jgi:hypothetical protein
VLFRSSPAGQLLFFIGMTLPAGARGIEQGRMQEIMARSRTESLQTFIAGEKVIVMHTEGQLPTAKGTSIDVSKMTGTGELYRAMVSANADYVTINGQTVTRETIREAYQNGEIQAQRAYLQTVGTEAASHQVAALDLQQKIGDATKQMQQATEAGDTQSANSLRLNILGLQADLVTAQQNALRAQQQDRSAYLSQNPADAAKVDAQIKALEAQGAAYKERSALEQYQQTEGKADAERAAAADAYAQAATARANAVADAMSAQAGASALDAASLTKTLNNPSIADRVRSFLGIAESSARQEARIDLAAANDASYRAQYTADMAAAEAQMRSDPDTAAVLLQADLAIAKSQDALAGAQAALANAPRAETRAAEHDARWAYDREVLNRVDSVNTWRENAARAELGSAVAEGVTTDNIDQVSQKASSVSDAWKRRLTAESGTLSSEQEAIQADVQTETNPDRKAQLQARLDEIQSRKGEIQTEAISLLLQDAVLGDAINKVKNDQSAPADQQQIMLKEVADRARDASLPAVDALTAAKYAAGFEKASAPETPPPRITISEDHKASTPAEVRGQASGMTVLVDVGPDGKPVASPPEIARFIETYGLPESYGADNALRFRQTQTEQGLVVVVDVMQKTAPQETGVRACP